MGSIHQVINAHQSEILNMWTQAARERPLARELTARELASTMPAFLAAIGTNGAADGHLSDEQRALVQHHLASRLRSGFDLHEILTEFATLGRCALRCLRRHHAATAGDVDEMFAELVLTAVEVTRIFDDQRIADEQALQRSIRRLQEIATDGVGLHEDGEPLRQRLREMLAVVMEAMAADTAALLLLDAKSHQLIMSASTGVADEKLEQYANSDDAATFAGKIASIEGEAIAVDDAATTELAVTDTLRTSGIHSLLGIRLSAHHSLRGVVYIGIREQRRFSPDEVKRLEKLGDALTLHLENARLYGALRAKMEEARIVAARSQRFASALLHELKGPLATASDDLRQLRDLDPGGPVAALGAKVLRTIESVHRTVDDLLDAHQIRAGRRLALVLADCELTAIARGVIDELRQRYVDRFIVRADQPVQGVWDAAELARALRHLLINAVEHGDADAPIFVLIRGGASGAELAVVNAGPPISEAQQAQLFSPFAMPRASNKGRHHGWGLGLTLVWGCAEAHGGRVEVKSAPGRGTVFVLALPYDARPYADS
jgi:signal transduction histidine kinase